LKLAPRSAVCGNNLGNHYLARPDDKQPGGVSPRWFEIDPGHANPPQLVDRVAQKVCRSSTFLTVEGSDQAAQAVQILRAKAILCAGKTDAALA